MPEALAPSDMQGGEVKGHSKSALTEAAELHCYECYIVMSVKLSKRQLETHKWDDCNRKVNM
eukprot:512417-Amphidinium_carterae.1